MDVWIAFSQRYKTVRKARGGAAGREVQHEIDGAASIQSEPDQIRHCPVGCSVMALPPSIWHSARSAIYSASEDTSIQRPAQCPPHMYAM